MKEGIINTVTENLINIDVGVTSNIKVYHRISKADKKIVSTKTIVHFVNRKHPKNSCLTEKKFFILNFSLVKI